MATDGNQGLIFLYHDECSHQRELQLSVHASYLDELRAACARKEAYRRGGELQGRLVLRVPERREDECRHLFRRRGFSIHSDHRSLRRGRVANLRFFHELSVERAAAGEGCGLVAEGGVARLRLTPGAFEDFFRFLCRFAEGHWAYRFDVDDELLVSSDIIDPTPAQRELWNEDI